MQLPDGRDCPYFYVNSHRRTSRQERCNLIIGTPDEALWSTALCATCRIPEIKQANACPTMTLSISVKQPGWRFWRKPAIVISAFCTRSGQPVEDPMVGCGLCHIQYEFVVAPDPADGTDTTDKES